LFALGYTLEQLNNPELVWFAYNSALAVTAEASQSRPELSSAVAVAAEAEADADFASLLRTNR
jgi:hypothetical protein